MRYSAAAYTILYFPRDKFEHPLEVCCLHFADDGLACVANVRVHDILFDSTPPTHRRRDVNAKGGYGELKRNGGQGHFLHSSSRLTASDMLSFVADRPLCAGNKLDEKSVGWDA